MKTQESGGIGMAAEAPKNKCSDAKCPYHGRLSVRGRHFTGIVISGRMRRTAVIEFERLHFLRKYERYEKRRTKMNVHNPDCINAKEGDLVGVVECRPLSKTKNFVIIRKLGVEKGFKGKMEAREASKIEAKKQESETQEAV
ncbi:30S ribosomal protein S17 [Candidatus Woesearchaeota archaeon]|nr:30S ribosomal protein S17 [Candidatus Woesearchaeota archaeon]